MFHKKNLLQMKYTGKIFIIVMFLLLMPILAVFSQNNKTIISGTLKNCASKKTFLYSSGIETQLVAETSIDSAGWFTFSPEINATDIYKLQFENGTYVSLILEPNSKIEISGDINDFMNTLRISGSEQSNLVYESNRQLMVFKTKLDSINTTYSETMQAGPNDSVMKMLIQGYKQTEQSQFNYIVSFITKYADYLTCLFIIDKLSIDDYFSTYEYLDQHLFTKYPENNYVLNFHSRVENAKKIALNSPAPEISLPNPDGKTISLSSFKGKVVLIDFWASWCNPCRKESPNMVRLYSTYHELGFEIFSVSLDKSKEAWIKAIIDDKLNWIHVSDLKYWQCEAALLYNVTSVPYTVLVDREGKIIAKGLRGQDLENKVGQLVKP